MLRLLLRDVTVARHGRSANRFGTDLYRAGSCSCFKGMHKVKLGPLSVGFFATSMVFNPFRKKDAMPAPTPTTRKVVLEGVAKAPDLPKPEPPTQDPFLSRLHASGRHQDFDPSGSVRTSQMTCPGCQAGFRIFLNADGRKTTVKCPGCAKYYKV